MLKKASVAIVSISGFLASVMTAHADVIADRSFSPEAPANMNTFVITGAVVIVAAVLAWLMIRVLRNRNVAGN